MCNIAGAIKNPKIKYHNSDLLKILSLFGANRGKDSCGLYYNNQDVHFVKTKSFNCDNGDANHIWVTNPFPQKITEPVVLLHNRQGTVGNISVDTSHPYIIDNNLVGIMNGTIYNHEELSEKYGIKEYHTDSELLFKIIHKFGYGVLSEYNGGAALAFFYKEEPNKLYLFKGASKEWTSATKIEDERPLFYAVYNGILYFNSLENPLKFITNMSSEVVPMPSNKILCFENTSLVSETNIDRSKCQQNRVVKNEVTHYYGGSGSYQRNYQSTYQKKENESLKEKNPQSEAKGNIYYYNEYYWRNGHKLDQELYVNLHDGSWSLRPTPGYEHCFFYNGWWIKDEETYYKILEDESKGVFMSYMHKYALSKSRDGEFYHGNSPVKAGKITPVFGYNTYYFNNRSKLVLISEAGDSTDDPLLEIVNKHFYNGHTELYCVTREEAEDLIYSIKGKKQVVWEKTALNALLGLVDSNDVTNYPALITNWQ